MSILEYTARKQSDEYVIERYQYIKYLPQWVDRINTPSIVTEIKILNEDMIYDTPNSNLVISGKITGDLTEENYKNIQFVKNGIMHLYSKITYLISNTEVEIINNPGYTTTVKGLTTFNKSDTYEGWDTKSIIDEKGYFSITIPLRNIFGIFESYNKCILRMSQGLQLIRAPNDDNCLIIPIELKDKVKIELTDVYWNVPHITPSLTKQNEINKLILGNTDINIKYREWSYESNSNIPVNNIEYTWRVSTLMRRPRYIIIAFSSNRDNVINKDNSKFDFNDVQNITVFLNTQRYPQEDMMLHVNNNSYSAAYTNYKNFKRSYFSNYLLNNSIVDKIEFKNDYPIFITDCLYQNETIKEQSIDIKVELKFRTGLPRNTIAHCWIIHDSNFAYNPYSNLTRKDL